MKIAFMLAALMRVALLIAAGGPYHAPDSKIYLGLAEHYNFSRMPLYPAALGTLGEHVTVWLQIAMDSVSAALIADISPVGGILYALSLGPAVYSISILTDTIAVACLSLAMWSVFRNKPAATGGALLCAVFTRDAFVALLPAFACLCWYGWRSSTSTPGK